MCIGLVSNQILSEIYIDIRSVTAVLAQCGSLLMLLCASNVFGDLFDLDYLLEKEAVNRPRRQRASESSLAMLTKTMSISHTIRRTIFRSSFFDYA
jgi:hypothetical protein